MRYGCYGWYVSANHTEWRIVLQSCFCFRCARANADDEGFDVDKKKESSRLLHPVVPVTFFNDAVRVVFLKFVSSDTLHCWT